MDNGRTTEFIRRRDYPDKTQCYECGEYGHLSYKCDKNTLGNRDPPPRKAKAKNKRKRKDEAGGSYHDSDEESEDGGGEPEGRDEESHSNEADLDTLSSVIREEVSWRFLNLFVHLFRAVN